MSPAKKSSGKRRTQGEGSITQRKDGVWQASIELPADGTGKRRRKYVYGSTKHEVVTKLNTVKSELQERGDVKTSHPTVAQWGKTFIAERAKHLRPASIRSYKSMWTNYIDPPLGKIKVSDLTVDHIESFHDYMAARAGVRKGNAGVSGTTQHDAHRLLKTALDHAMRRDYCYRNVASLIDAPKSSHRELNSWTFEESKQFLQHVSEDRNASRYAFALLTGARAGETLGLQWSNVDFEHGLIHLRKQLTRADMLHGCGTVDGSADGAPRCGYHRPSSCPQATPQTYPGWNGEQLDGGLFLGPLKTKSGKRTLPLVEPLRSILLAHREATKDDPNPHGLVWTANPRYYHSPKNPALGRLMPLTGRPVEPGNDSTRWKEYTVSAGVRQIRRHDARRTAITLLLNLGVAPSIVKEIVGHSNIDMTELYWADSLPPATAALLQLAGMVPESMLSAVAALPDLDPEGPDVPPAIAA